MIHRIQGGFGRGVRRLAALLLAILIPAAVMATPQRDEMLLGDMAGRQTGRQVINIERIKGDGSTPWSWYAVQFEEHPDRVFFTNRDAAFFTSVDRAGGLIYHRNDLSPVSQGDKRGLKELMKKAISGVDPADFIDVIHGRPEKNLYIVTDPQCPYCNKLAALFDRGFVESDNVRLRYVFMPLSTMPTSKAIATSIYCSPDPGRALVEWYRTRRPLRSDESESCRERADQKMMWPQIMGFDMVPTVFFEDGEEYAGAFDLGRIRQKLGLPPLR